MNVLITAGGTSEKIDNVRNITNFSTGKLCSLIAESFSEEPEIKKIFYLCTKTSAKPKSDKVEIVYIRDVASVQSAIENVVSENEIHIIIHGMAVSDYRVRSVSTVSVIADLFFGGEMGDISIEDADERIVDHLVNSGSIIDNNGKINSNVDNMILLMERTPKLISMFRALSPKSVLVGFKLMDGVEPQKLIDTAYRLLNDNKCNFVLANDIRSINDSQHIGYLIDESKSFSQYPTKAEIAKAIVNATIEKWRTQP